MLSVAYLGISHVWNSFAAATGSPAPVRPRPPWLGPAQPHAALPVRHCGRPPTEVSSAPRNCAGSTGSGASRGPGRGRNPGRGWGGRRGAIESPAAAASACSQRALCLCSDHALCCAYIGRRFLRFLKGARCRECGFCLSGKRNQPLGREGWLWAQSGWGPQLR